MSESDTLRQLLVQAASPRYTVGEEIGHGGMAVVFRGFDNEENRPVAMKVLRQEFALVMGHVRFQREIRVLSELHHEGILPLLSPGGNELVQFYTMPLVAGETLAARLEREPQLPLDTIRRVITQVAAALDYAHGRGVVHRDIKPSNLFLDGEKILVADFGIAKELTPRVGDITTSTGLVVGTVEYMSPEQADSHARADTRSDVYSLGCVAYEMLAGEAPFTGASVQAIVARHRSMPPPSARLIRPDLPAGIDGVIGKALAKSPADRYQRAGDFAAALNDPPPVSKEPSSGRSWTRPAAGALALLALFAILLRFIAPASPVLDPRKVIGYPLVESGPASSTSDAGELVAIMIGRALEHAEPLKWLDGWSRIPVAERQDIRLLSPEQAREVARRAGAAYYLSGRIIQVQDSSMVLLQLHDVSSDSLLEQSSAAGLAGSSLPGLGFQALVALLPRLLGEGRGLDPATVAAFERRMPGAVANWLQGEREFRRSRYASALALLSRAVQQDSSFALPAARGAEAADWIGAHQEAAALIEVARRSGGGLPAKYADYAAGLDAYLRGEADSAVTSYRSALGLDSTWAPAWMALGETYFHLLPSTGDPDSVAEDAFRRAQRFDPSLAPPLYHLFDLALFRGDVPAADSLYSAYRGFGPDSSWATETRLRLTCVRNPSKVDWKAEVQEHPIEVVSAAKLLLSNPRFWPCSDAAFRSARTSDNAAARWGGVFGLTTLLLAQQRRREAEAELDSAVAGGLGGAMGLYVVAAAGGFGMDAKAAAAMSALPSDLGKLDAPALWFAGIWAFHAGDTVRLRSYAERLDSLAAASPADRTLAGITDAVGARLALARLDTTRAISRLQRVRSTVPGQTLWWGIREPYALERLLLVRLLMARGRLDEALAAVQSLGHHGPVLFVPLLSESLELRALLSARLGRSDVNRYRMAIANLRKASPEFRN